MMRPGVDGPPVFLCLDPVDFRKSINGLSLIVEQSMELNPFELALYVFINRKRDKLKILYWEKNGFFSGIKACSKNASSGHHHESPQRSR